MWLLETAIIHQDIHISINLPYVVASKQPYIPSKDVFHDWNENAESILTENGPLCDLRQVPVL